MTGIYGQYPAMIKLGQDIEDYYFNIIVDLVEHFINFKKSVSI